MKPSKAQTFEDILTELEPRLDELGAITTDEAWRICQKISGSYPTIAGVFRQIMGLMVEQGKAVKVRNGKWNILKPNRTKKIQNENTD